MTIKNPAKPSLRWFAFICIGCLLWPCLSQAQDAKLRRDVTYSTHNYKHPNKAAQARKWEQPATVDVNAPASVASRNYKQPMNATEQPQEEGIVLRANRDQLDMDRNYKNQHPSQLARDRQLRKMKSPMEERPAEVEPTGN